MNEPRISVIIPCRNMGKFLGDAIRSALAQTYAVHEIIVVDDGSTDNTLQVARGFGQPVKVLHGSGQGSAIARNLGIVESTGDHIAFLDADDIWYPEKLARQVPLLNDEQRLVFTDFVRGVTPAQTSQPVLREYTVVSDGWVFSRLLRENFISTTSVLVSKRVLADTGMFKPALIGGQDFDLWLRLARRTRFGLVREPLLFMRSHGGNITASDKYIYYHARVWQEVLWEHRDQVAEVPYIKSRCSDALYAAGRQALRHEDPAAARGYFRLSLGGFHHPIRTLWWLAIACLPGWLLKQARYFKRALQDLDDEVDSEDTDDRGAPA